MHRTISTPDYNIYLGDISTSLSQIVLSNYSAIVVLVDHNTKRDCYPVFTRSLGIDHHLIEIPPGEEHKHIETCLYIWRKMMEIGLDRKSLCINLGGGVLCDMGGFSAACYMRGIDFIHVPTTLLSQVDASIGGKLGVDLDTTKNLVGLIQTPQAVLIDPAFLDTLPERERRSGYAEILKHGLIRNQSYYHDAVKAYPPNPERLADIIETSLHIKNDIVVQDPREQGLRKLLNFGHTIGHAIESLSMQGGREPLLHGEAIAIGIICEAHIALQLEKIDDSTLSQITSTTLSIYDEVDLTEYDTQDLWDLMLKDKKNNSGIVLCTLIEGIGKGVYNAAITSKHLAESVRYYTGL